MAEQSFSNHAKWVPAFHYFALPVLLLNLIATLVHVAQAGFSVMGLIAILTAIALVISLFLGRTFALGVQDRVIRLEERMRMQRLLPADLQPRIEEFTCPQLIALRFASDAELPALARRVLVDKITDAKSIKQAVQNWRADNQRI